MEPTKHNIAYSWVWTIKQPLQVTNWYHRNVPLNLTIDESLKFLINNKLNKDIDLKNDES